MEDSGIIQLFLQRSGVAVAALSGKYERYCYAIAYNILGSAQDAEECVNDAFLGVWNAIPPHQPLRLGAFVGKITRRLAFNRRRADRAEKRGGGVLPLILEELAECVDAPRGVEEEVQQRELELAVHGFLSGLPPRDRDIFLRRYFFVEPVGEIAGRYAMGENAVSAALSRTRKKLRTHLEREGWL